MPTTCRCMGVSTAFAPPPPTAPCSTSAPRGGVSSDRRGARARSVGPQPRCASRCDRRKRAASVAACCSAWALFPMAVWFTASSHRSARWVYLVVLRNVASFHRNSASVAARHHWSKILKEVCKCQLKRCTSKSLPKAKMTPILSLCSPNMIPCWARLGSRWPHFGVHLGQMNLS